MARSRLGKNLMVSTNGIRSELQQGWPKSAIAVEPLDGESVFFASHHLAEPGFNCG